MDVVFQLASSLGGPGDEVVVDKCLVFPSLVVWETCTLFPREESWLETMFTAVWSLHGHVTKDLALAFLPSSSFPPFLYLVCP